MNLAERFWVNVVWNCQIRIVGLLGCFGIMVNSSMRILKEFRSSI
jgi:hypothetical protein